MRRQVLTSIFSAGDGAGPTVVAHDGAQAPGTSVGVRFIDMKRINKLSDATINDVGQTAFTMGLTGLGVTDRNNSGIWVGSDIDDLVLVVRDGDPAPGTASGVYFTGFDNLALSAGGKMAFQGVLTDSMYSIWSRDEEGGLTMVAREGDTAPGTTDDAKFLKFRSLAINSAGQVAFSATLSNFSVGRNGIWAKDPSGTLKLIAREGEMLDVDDGPGTDYRTISELSFRPGDTGNQDGRPSGFNNLGQLVFAADFADGSSGVFVHSLVAIPEPSTMLLSGLAAAGLLMLVSKTARSNGS